jgi:hypothetical protein
MQNPAQFWRFAEECERLAEEMPNEKDALLAMARAWRKCAHEAEHKSEQRQAS